MPSPRRRAFTPLVKPAGGDCQLACTYCFYRVNPIVRSGEDHPRMPDRVLERFTGQYLAYQPDGMPANICWQGGEPLLMGHDFFRQAVAYQKQFKRPGQQVVNSMQTNGVALDRAFAKFFHEEEFLVGISLDGPQDIHDATRRHVGGGVSHDQVMTAIEHMRAERVQFNILTVLHDGNAARAGEIYEFFRSQGFRFMQFIACAETLPKSGKLAPYALKPDQYADALGQIFRRWRRDLQAGDLISCRFFDHIVNKLVGAGSAMCLFEGHCDGQIVIENDGSTYPCDWHVDEKWYLGNVLEKSFEELVNQPTMEAFIERSHRRPAKCESCRFFPLCRGGCPKHRELLTGTAEGENLYCEAYQRFYTESIGDFEQIATMLRRQFQPPPPPRPQPTATPASRNAPCPCGSGKKYKQCCGRRGAKKP